ncbi:MAG: hypothetical protein P9L94_13765 [Candidatus Hinthialibacter antarcticus]|nr:hypothetical protein [Candidatus Hinthialibacter antarcticus]
MQAKPKQNLPLLPPQVDPNFLQQNPVFQILESLRFTIPSIEYTLSPRRTLRNLLKICLYYWLMLCIPALLFLPLLHFAFVQLNSITLLLAESISHLILPVSFTAVFVLLLLFILRR